MSRILCLCDEGNNRSVTVAHQLKYLGHDCIPAGTKRNSLTTLHMLCDWADHIILTQPDQTEAIPTAHLNKTQLWDIGPDVFPRPLNKTLLAVVKKHVERNRATLTEPTPAQQR